MIGSDASRSRWGAHCQGRGTGGPWSPQEKTMRINCLELLAVTLALKIFAKSKMSLSVLMRINNKTAVTQSGRDSIGRIGPTDSRPVDVVPRKEHSRPHPASPRQAEHSGWQGVKVNARPFRLESGLDDLPEDQPDFWSSGSGPVRA